VLVLHQFEISPFCDKIRRILRVKRQPFEVREVPPSSTLTSLRKINPARKLPTLEHDGGFVADSTDIALWIEERFPDPPLVPGDPRERALCFLLEDWADESLYFYEATMRFTWPENARRWVPILNRSEPAWLGRLSAPIVPRMVAQTVRAQGIGRKSRERIAADAARLFDSIEALLGGDWLVGGALSLADISVFAQLHCIGGTDQGATWIAARPRLEAWMRRVDAATS